MRWDAFTYLIRIIGFGFRGPKMRVPEMDLTGNVGTIGANVTRFQVGDECSVQAR